MQLGDGLADVAAGLLVDLAGARTPFILAGAGPGALAVLPTLIHALPRQAPNGAAGSTNHTMDRYCDRTGGRAGSRTC